MIHEPQPSLAYVCVLIITCIAVVRGLLRDFGHVIGLMVHAHMYHIIVMSLKKLTVNTLAAKPSDTNKTRKCFIYR